MTKLKVIFPTFYFGGLVQERCKSIASAMGLVQERRNSIANALESRLFCTAPWIYPWQPFIPRNQGISMAICVPSLDHNTALQTRWTKHGYTQHSPRMYKHIPRESEPSNYHPFLFPRACRSLLSFPPYSSDNILYTNHGNGHLKNEDMWRCYQRQNVKYDFQTQQSIVVTGVYQPALNNIRFLTQTSDDRFDDMLSKEKEHAYTFNGVLLDWPVSLTVIAWWMIVWKRFR